MSKVHNKVYLQFHKVSQFKELPLHFTIFQHQCIIQTYIPDHYFLFMIFRLKYRFDDTNLDKKVSHLGQ